MLGVRAYLAVGCVFEALALKAMEPARRRQVQGWEVGLEVILWLPTLLAIVIYVVIGGKGYDE